MSGRGEDIVAGVLLDEEQVLSLAEVCRSCDISVELITEMVDYGIVEPLGEQPEHWQFTGIGLRRVTTVLRLQRDLGVNLPGAALALDLMDELRELRRRV